MARPDYQSGSIVNLMSSLRLALGGVDFGYPPLAWLSPEDLDTRHLILMVIDGLGYNYLSNRSGSTLNHYLREPLTSVFPTTTASAITSFYTGVAPQQHAITGWFMWFRELGSVTAVLPFIPRHGGVSYAELGVEPRQLFNRPSVFADLRARCHMVNPAHITDSAYSRAGAGPAERHPATDIAGFFNQLRTIVATRGSEKTFTFAYWAKLDALSHEYGAASPEVAAHFEELDCTFRAFIQDIEGSRATVLVTADHGHIDTAPDRVLHLEEHPALREDLTLPLCGDPRVAYCYVRAHRRGHFETYIDENLSHCCELQLSQRLLEQGYFGLGTPHPRLQERIGDYILLMKDNYVISERLAGESPFSQTGVHGGLSADELYVPLVVVRT